MISIGGAAITNQLCQDLRAACFSKFQVFQDQHSGPLAHDKTIAQGIKGTAGPLRIVVAAREGMHIIESSHSDRGDGFLGAARNHRFCIATADGLPCLADGVAAGRASRDRRPVGSPGSSYNRDHAGSAIDDHHANKKWADTARPLLIEHPELFMQCYKAADTAPDVDAHIIGNIVCNLQICLAESLLGSGNGKMFIGIVTPYLFRVHIERRVKILNLSAKANPKLAGIIRGNLVNARSPLTERLPSGCKVIAQRGNQSQSGYNYARHKVTS